MALLPLLLLLRGLFPVHSVDIPSFSSTCSRILGDVNLAVMVDLTVPSPGTLCFNAPNSFWSRYIQQLEAVAYTLREINQRQDVLPGVTLGYVGMDTCFSTLAALAQFNNLVSDPPITNTSDQSSSLPCEQLSLVADRIVGIAGPSTSDQATLVSSQAGVYRLPVLSPMASSYELSDKGRYKYFSRLLSPNTFQVEATLDFLQLHNWTYVSFLYLEGSYGEGAAKTMVRSSRARGICLAVYEMLPSEWTVQDLEDLGARLAARPTARVVILYLYENHIRQLIDIVARAHPAFSPIWFGSTSVGAVDFGPLWHGAFTIRSSLAPAPAFAQYMRSATPKADGRGNLWLPQLWERLLSCSWAPEDNTTTPCSQYENSSLPDMDISVFSSKYVEVAQTFAYAMDALIRKNCPEVLNGTNSTSQVYDCVTKYRLLDYLRNVDFEGLNGPVMFDANGDRYSLSSIYQYVYANGQGTYVRVADYYGRNASLHVFPESINWTLYSTPGGVGRGVGDSPRAAQSVCSQPCGPKEYAVLTDELCCWECRPCRVNERLNDNRTDCDPCPALTWPDQLMATVCEPIPAVSTSFTDPLGAGMLVLAVVGLVCGLTTSGWYVARREARLIKASSRELSAFILVGVVLANLTILLMLTRPSHVLCQLRLAGFHVSVSFIFAPLFVKTNRIYRIFSAGKKGLKSPRFIGNKVQVVITALLLLVQVIITVVVEITVPSRVVHRQPVSSEPYVEELCDLPYAALLPGLSFNLVMKIMCVVFGFLTRKLPANFNESWYIFVSVATTLFLWLVFLPTYFTAFYASNQVMLLCCLLFFNASVTLVCLFWPKVYALVAKDESEMNVSTMTNSTKVTSQGD